MHDALRKNYLIMLILSLIFSVGVRAFFSFPLDNVYLPGGTDTNSHLFRSWYVAEKGLTKWNFYWAGGHPFLRYCYPLQYLISGYLGKIIGWLLAYKIVVDAFFVLTPLAFYFFLKEFKLQNNKMALATVIFSLFPVYFYFLFDGRHPTLISFFFCILYWKFLKGAVDRKKLSYLLLSSIFLCLGILTHYLTAAFALGITFIWLLSHSPRINSIIKFSKILAITLLMSMWFWAPFLIETLVKQRTLELPYLVAKESPIERGKIYLLSPFTWVYAYLAFPLAPYIILALVATLGVFCFISLLKIDRITKEFFIVFIFIIFLLFASSYKRVFMYIPIAVSILACQGIYSIKKFRRIAISILLALVVISGFSLKGQVYALQEAPSIPKDGRIIYYPTGWAFSETEKEIKVGYELLFSPMKGNEIITGWLVPGEIGPKKSGFAQGVTIEISDPLLTSSDNYYNILKKNWVNYVAVNKRSQELVRYFNESENFKLYSETNLFFVFEAYPKSSYIEIDNQTVQDAKIIKENDEITINFTCHKGILTIKENYHPLWKGELNGREININQDENEFMRTEIKDGGVCYLKLSFKDPQYYIIFKAIPLASIIIVFLLLARKLSIFKQLKNR